MNNKIIYTLTDEAPALATYSLLPIVQAFTKAANCAVETRDISLAGRILAQFPANLTAEQAVTDDLAELGEIAKTPEANIIKLPNISASVPQLLGAIQGAEAAGVRHPRLSGGAAQRGRESDQGQVREGARQRRQSRAARRQLGPPRRGLRQAVREEAPALDGPLEQGLENARRKHGRRRFLLERAIGDRRRRPASVTIELTSNRGEKTVLKEGVSVKEGDVLGASSMSRRALRDFYAKQIADTKAKGLLLSLHLKATMMKVSDPIMFGHAVEVYYQDVFQKHADTLKELGVAPNNGIGDLYAKIKSLPDAERSVIEADLAAVYQTRPELAMVDSSKGITNLHVPSDVIIDASMPAAIRASGQMWGPDGKLHDTKALIPDRCYAGIYQEVIDDCRKNGAFDVPTMGNVSNVGLMAQKAEEYGSHDKTFEFDVSGTVRVLDADGKALMEHRVEQGDIWRMCQTRDLPIRDWVKLAVNRARATGQPAIFWLDENRAYDRNVIDKVRRYLRDHDTNGLDIRIMSPVNAIRATLKRVRDGVDTISVTGNVLRDYLTDLFPILELGTSAKMLSIVPLLAGGGLYETGAGGSAPKHVQQFLQENYLRWDSLGEFLALAVSLEDYGTKTDNPAAVVLAEALDTANGRFLENDKSPSRAVGGIDNRGSHFYLAMYWARAVADQTKNDELRSRFDKIAAELTANEQKIVGELLAVQGKPVDIGGYYHPNPELTAKAMRPSNTLNAILAAI